MNLCHVLDARGCYRPRRELGPWPCTLYRLILLAGLGLAFVRWA